MTKTIHLSYERPQFSTMHSCSLYVEHLLQCHLESGPAWEGMPLN